MTGPSLMHAALPDAVPPDAQAFLGDPARGPEPEERFRESHRPPMTEITWPVNEGNPFTDWGHFRLRLEASGQKRLGAPLRLPAPPKEQIAEIHGRFVMQDWKDGSQLKYSILEPDSSVPKPADGWPLVIYAPGSGAVGKPGIPNHRFSDQALWATDLYRKEMPAVVVLLHPMQRSITMPGDTSKGQFGVAPTPVFERYLELIDHLAARPDIDRRRISIYGHSMGGSTVWALLRARPNLFSAAAPLAGLPFPEAADYKKLTGTPIWMMMGHNDPWTGSALYLRAYARLREAGHPRVRFWEIQDIKHGEEVFGIHPLLHWLWNQRRD